MDRVKFVIVEKSYLIRKGIASIINRIEHATVVKELETLDEINSTLLRFLPDFLVINLSLLKEIGTIRNAGIKADLSRICIGIDSENASKNYPPEELREIISTLDDRDIIYKKLQALIREKVESRHLLSGQNELSEREKTILKHVAKGLTNKEIAETLFLSTHTVITHRKNITNKLGIKTISGLTVYAILNSIINIGDLH